MAEKFDNRLQKILAEEVEKERAGKKKKKLEFRKEKRLMYFSRWNKNNKPHY